MSVSDNNTPATPVRGPRHRGRFLGILAVTVIAVGTAGVFARTALSDEGGWHSRWNHSDGARHGMMFKASLDPAEVEERIGKVVGQIAVEVDATSEQQEKLTVIFTGAATDLIALRGEIGDRTETAKELIDMLTAPTVDPAAVEAFRAEKLAVADKASRVVAGALVEASEVLTAEQREKIGDRLEFLARLSAFHRG